tara:strand:- start:39 stop:2243 length:2205 start_codon:yes stop_codon:yes gene_type:complete
MPEVNVHLPEGTITFNVFDTGGNEENARIAAESICREVYKDNDGVFHTTRPTPGCDEIYDTLDNFPLESLKDIKSLDEVLIGPLVGVVGVIIGGLCALSDPSDGYWGRGLRLLTGEHIQVRQTPRGLVGKPIGDEARMIAVRITGHSQNTQVFAAIVFKTRKWNTDEQSTPMTTARTTGCRGVHLLLPALFNKHNAHRDTSIAHPDKDLDGFHSIRPSIANIITKSKSNSRHSTKDDDISAICPGYSYLVMAAHMAGLDQPHPMTRASQIVSREDHVHNVNNITRRICDHVGGTEKAGEFISSAMIIADLLGADGILGMMCNSFFEGILPDMIHAPVGMSLIIVMAMRIACYPERVGLKQDGTRQDIYAIREMCTLINSRWMPVSSDGMLAIDAVIDSSLKNARERIKEDNGMAMYLDDHLTFWQRVGQRIVAKAVTDPSGMVDEEGRSGSSDSDTPFGRAELLEDVLSDTKYKLLAKAGMAQPIYETVANNNIRLASKADIRTTLVRVHDSVETWLRTGMYGDMQLGGKNSDHVDQVDTIARPRASKKITKQKKKNKTADLPSGICPCYADMILTGKDCDCIKSPVTNESDINEADDADDADDDGEILEEKLSLDAIENATGAASIAMLHGAFVVHQLGIKTYLVGDGCSNLCADCDNVVTPLQAVLLNSSVGECSKCNRRRCYDCADKALGKVFKPVEAGCKRCGEKEKSDKARKPLDGSSSSTSKGKKKKK